MKFRYKLYRHNINLLFVKYVHPYTHMHIQMHTGLFSSFIYLKGQDDGMRVDYVTK